MSDIFSKKERSRIMSLIKSRDTGFELGFRKLLSERLYPAGFRYRKHSKNVIGKPDIVFVKQKIAVFLDSDFWHGNKYENASLYMKQPYWRKKIARNIERDRFVNKSLRSGGWKVFRLRESEIRKKPDSLVKKVFNEVAQKCSAI